MNGKTLARRKRKHNGGPVLGPVDAVLLHTLALLLGFGVVMVASASLAIAQMHGHGSLYYLEKTLVFLAAGLVGMALMVRMPMEWWERIAPSLILFVFILLLLVFVPGLGVEVKGARRWIRLVWFNVQVVELVKLLLLLWLAAYVVRHGEALQRQWSALLRPIVLLGLVAGLLLLQPDFGSTVLVMAMAVTLLWFGGARLLHLLVLALVALPVLWLELTRESYRLERLSSFIDPWRDPTDTGFQLIQALIAIGRGEWTGTGLGGSIQKLYYLPEAHNDFILAVIAEELGFIGVLLLVLLYGVLLWRCIRIGQQAMAEGKPFHALVSWGVAAWLGMQALISMAVNVGLLPTKGLTLPLVSAGGSSLVMSCLAVGLVMRVSREVRLPQRGGEVVHA